MQFPNLFPIYLILSLASGKKTAGGDKKDSTLLHFAFSSLFYELTHNPNRQRELVMVSKVSDTVKTFLYVLTIQNQTFWFHSEVIVAL